MLKEIHEQPKAVGDTIASLVKDGRIDLTTAGLTKEILEGVSEIHIAACGSAWHAGMVGQYVIEDLAEVPVKVELGSEFRYKKLLLDQNALLIVISQSGETADTLAALRAAKSQGIRTLAVVNVIGSTIAREADNVLYTLAGPEIAVATTKAYSLSQCTLWRWPWLMLRVSLRKKITNITSKSFRLCLTKSAKCSKTKNAYSGLHQSITMLMMRSSSGEGWIML